MPEALMPEVKAPEARIPVPRSPVLSLKSVGKDFSDNFSLDGICMDLYPGEVHMIVGENGSGKSVLMKLICGIHRRDRGTIVLSGREVDFSSSHESRSAGIWYQHQNPQLYENLGVAENVFFSRIPRARGLGATINPYRLHGECSALFARLGIGIDPETPVASLGYTQKLLVAACQAVISEAPVVIFDEPTAGMTDVERGIFFRMVRGMRENGTGIFCISHKLDEIGLIGDRVTVIHNGRVAGSTSGASIRRDELIRMMTGRSCPERYPRLNIGAGPIVLSVEHLASGSALSDVSFTLRRGEIAGLAGLMGSGRTRLANCLFGHIRPDSGTIRLDGEEVRFSHPSQALGKGIALIPEDRDSNAVFREHTIVGNMTSASLARFKDGLGLDGNYMEELTVEYIRNLGIMPGNFFDLIRYYSGGNQQKVVVARWLMSLAHIFIMDEPTRGVDAAARIDIYNAMNDLIAKGASILFISSELEEIMGMCDRILVLAGGRIVADLPRGSAGKEAILDLASLD